MADRCSHCPVECGLPCRGLETPVYCQRAKVNPAIREILVKHAWQMVANRQVEAPPPLYQRALAFMGAVARHVATGMHHAPPEVQAARLAICYLCEHHRGEQCTICGCADKGLKLKTSWANQSCPLKPPKWGPVADQSAAAAE